MDVARTALRKGAEEVTVLYRRGEKDMTATQYEYQYARLDGVKFKFYRSPLEIVDEGVICTETRKEKDGDVVRVVPIEGSEKLFQADSVFIAASQNPRNNLTGIEIGKTGLILVNEDGRTTREGIFASGDVVTGAKTVAEAVNLSKRSAQAIMDYIAGLPD